ncbi:MAG TPA: enoyl-CoA hydratase/isomerase family protein [Pseudonocardia sp.]|jgi:enoyl-CoA hydratase
MALWSLSTVSGGAVAVASYSNPPMNYFTLDAAQELQQLIQAWDADRSLRVIVLRGDGRSSGFITHFSVETLAEIAATPESARAGAAPSRGFHALLDRLNKLPQAVVVAMNGDTMGGGFELSLACDIRVGQAGDHRYGLPEARLGIMPGGGGTQRLPRLIGPAKALEFVLRARMVTPDEALRLGLVHEVAEDSVARALEIAGEIATLPATSIASIKAAMYQGLDTNLTSGLTIESGYFLETMLSDAARERMGAYLEQPENRRRDWLEAVVKT